MIIDLDTSKPFSMYDEKITAKCFFCGKNAPSRIYYMVSEGDGSNCVCRECEHIIKGLFKDVLLAESEFKADSLEERLNSFAEETKKQLNGFNEKFKYKYFLEVDIEDYFEDTYTLEEIQQKDSFYSLRYKFLCEFMKEQMNKRYGEEPHTIRFFSTPHYVDLGIEYGETICGIAKIYNNGTTVIFGDDFEDLSQSRFNSFLVSEVKPCNDTE